MRAKSVSAEEQYRLVLECKASGMSDYQWCLEHDIKPGTFYNWVRRLRESGYQDMPEAAKAHKPVSQEVVRVEIAEPAHFPERDAPQIYGARSSMPLASSMEIALNGAVLRVPNGTDPLLLDHAVKLLGAMAC